MFALVALAVASVLASAVLFQHMRFTTWLAAAGILFEGQWLLITLLKRTLFVGSSLETFYLLTSVLLLLLWILMLRSVRWPRFSRTTLLAELMVVVSCAVIVTGLVMVVRHNGYVDGEYVMHGFYNGDTATFIALTERSFTEHTLLEKNPFSGNGPLEYPTLVHAAWANFFLLLGASDGWLQLLEPLTVLMLLCSIPTFFLLWDTVFPEPLEPWKKWLGIPSRAVVRLLQAGVVLYIVALSWDSYIYPQSHFFLLGIFLVLIALLLRTGKAIGVSQLRFYIPAATLGLILLFANAVTGTAAIAGLLILHLFRANDPTRSISERTFFLITTVAWAGAVVLISPGEAVWGLPGFSYTAALDMLRLAPVVLLLISALILNLERHRLLVGISVGFMTMACATFFFSQRNIVIDNASRFFYHALLVGYPLLIIPLIRGFYTLRRELFLTTRTLFEKTAGLMALSVGLLLFLLPAGASMASNMDALLFKNETRISSEELTALEWVKTTPTESLFAANPDGPWTIPIFTGRALLRTNYWLSAEDTLQVQVAAAFAGNITAQQRVLQEIDYLYLRTSERASWHLDNDTPVFENDEIVIYQGR